MEFPVFQWNPDIGDLNLQALEGVDTIVNLAGEPVAEKRWSSQRKMEIIQSRIKSIDTLYNALKSGKHSVKTLISASATGFYGDSGEDWVDENSPPGKDFLGRTCQEWENSLKRIQNLGIRVVILRIGFVLAKNGGALPVLKKQVNFFAASALGSGKQFISWVHIDDVCRLIIQAIQNEKMIGVYNAVAPSPVSNKNMIQALAQTLHRPFWPFTVPSVLLRLILGEKADIILHGQKVSASKVLKTNFVFQYNDLNECLRDVV